MRVIHYLTIFLGIVIILIGALLLPTIAVNNDIKSTFTEESERQQRYETLNQLFKQSKDPLIISFYKADGFNTYKDWKQLQGLSNKFKTTFPQDSLVSIFEIKTLKRVGSNLYEKPLINLSGEELYEGWKERVQSYDYLSANFISKDFKKVNFYVYLSNWSAKKEGQINALLKEGLNQSYYDQYFLLSDPIVNEFIKERVVSDLYSLALFGFIIILGLFYFFFRSFKIIVLIGVIAAINVNATIILMYLVGLEFNILTSIVPTIISILSVTDLNHIAYATKEEESVSLHLNRLPIKTGLLRLKKTLIATSVTTAIGFAIFLFNDVSSVRVFALISILGIFISLASVFIFSPSFYRFLAPGNLKSLSFTKLADAIGRIVSAYYRLISVGFMILLLVVSIATYFFIHIDYNPRNNLNKDSKLSQSIAQFDQSFQNTKVVNVIASFPEGTSLIEVTAHLDGFEQRLLKQLPDAKITSINNVIKEYNRVFNKGKLAFYQLPNQLDSTITNFLKSDTIILPYFYQPAGNHFKMVIQMPYYNATFTQDQLNELNEINPSSSADLKSDQWVIGSTDYYEDKSALGLVKSVLSGIFISIFIISLLTAIFFRNRGYFLPTLLVNLFPILSSLLLVSFLYGQVNPSIVIILSIAFGIALDDTMYFVSKLKHTSRQTSFAEMKSVLLDNIVRNTFPMVSTSVTLSGSFCALLFSSFEINTINAFILIATLLIAMVSDLIILPALILFFHKKGKF